MTVATPIDTRPYALTVQPDNIPESLKSLRTWVVWKYEYVPTKNGKPARWTKPPYIARSPQTLASTTDPSTWGSFDDAMHACTSKVCDGIGLVLIDDQV